MLFTLKFIIIIYIVSSLYYICTYPIQAHIFGSHSFVSASPFCIIVAIKYCRSWCFESCVILKLINFVNKKIFVNDPKRLLSMNIR